MFVLKDKVMEKSEIVVGLDIGTTKIVVVVATRNSAGRAHILGYGKAESIGVVRGSVYNVDKTATAISAAVHEAELSSQVDIKEVYVGIAGQHIRSRQQKGSLVRHSQDEEISYNDIKSLIDSIKRSQVEPGEKILHVIPQEFVVDGISGLGVDDVVGMSGVNLEATFHVVTANLSAMRNIERSLSKAQLEVAGFVLEPLVSAEATLDDTDKEAGVVLVDIGGGTTDIAVFKERVLCHTGVIPLAGNIITSDIKDGCGIMSKQAEVLKVKYGSSLPEENSVKKIVSIPGIRGRQAKEISLKTLSEFINARVVEILNFVAADIESSGECYDFIGGIVLTGGGSKLKHIIATTEMCLGVSARIGYPMEHLSTDSPKELNDPAFSTAIGLILYGLRYEKEKECDAKHKKDIKHTNKVEVDNDSDAQAGEQITAEVEPKKPNKVKSMFDDLGGVFKGLINSFDDEIK